MLGDRLSASHLVHKYQAHCFEKTLLLEIIAFFFVCVLMFAVLHFFTR